MKDCAERTDQWIEFDGHRYRVAEGKTALDSMLAGGAQLFFSCRKGTCRSCMLEAVSGDPGTEGTQSLPSHLREQGLFLPCVTTNPRSVVAKLPDQSKMVTRCVLQEKEEIGPNIWKFVLETETTLDWIAGQFLSIKSAKGELRSYSIVSRPDEYFIELHVRHYPEGAVSNWLVNDVEIGAMLEIVGPTGDFYYSREMAENPLLLAGSGSGGGVLLALAKDALQQGHAKPIHLLHAARRTGGHYLGKALQKLADEHPNFTFEQPVISDNGDFVGKVLSDKPDISETILFLCGAPDLVEATRISALRDGAKLSHLKSDPFESPIPYVPQDSAKIEGFPPDPEFWDALEQGKLLTKILDAFYTRAMADSRLGPFFHKVTKDRLVGKQYSFTSDLLLGRSNYFGERPFNSHHWMIISDELFDYREEMFFEVVRSFGLPQKFQARWAAFNEMFRREIVKAAPRGQWLDGREHFKPTYQMETLDIDMVCDSCFEEIPAGTPLRHHTRTGEVFCQACIDRATTDTTN